MARTIEELERERRTKEEEGARLKEKLEGLGDYDEIRRELEIMKVRFSLSNPDSYPMGLCWRVECYIMLIWSQQYVEFAGLDLDELPSSDPTATDAEEQREGGAMRLLNPNTLKANHSRTRPLEDLLMAKNRKIQDELTGLRVRFHRFLIHSLLLHHLDCYPAYREPC